MDTRFKRQIVSSDFTRDKEKKKTKYATWANVQAGGFSVRHLKVRQLTSWPPPMKSYGVNRKRAHVHFLLQSAKSRVEHYRFTPIRFVGDRNSNLWNSDESISVWLMSAILGKGPKPYSHEKARAVIYNFFKCVLKCFGKVMPFCYHDPRGL